MAGKSVSLAFGKSRGHLRLSIYCIELDSDSLLPGQARDPSHTLSGEFGEVLWPTIQDLACSAFSSHFLYNSFTKK